MIDVTIDTVALKEVLGRGGEIAPARTVRYRDREVNGFSGRFTVPRTAPTSSAVRTRPRRGDDSPKSTTHNK